MPAVDSASLEQLFNNEAATEAARRAENANTNRMDTLRRLENASLDRLRARDIIEAAPRAPTPAPGASALASGANRAMNAARSIPIPTTGTGLLNAGTRALNAAAAFQIGGAGQGLSDAASTWLGDQLPNQVQPIYDGLDNLRRQVGNTLNPGEALGRASRDLSNLRPSGLGTLGMPGDPFSAPLTCNLFGVGCPERSPEGIPNNGSLPAAPPFYGGQTPGINYNVTINFQWIAYYTVSGQDRDFSGSKLGTFTGRITSISARRDGTSGAYIDVVHNSGNSTYTYTISGDNSQNTNLRFSITNISVVRADGQPDTGGNPAAQPGAPSQPGIVPPTSPIPAPRTYPTAQPGNPIAPGALSPSPAINPATQPITPPAVPPVATPPTPPANRPREDNPINPLIPLGILGGLGLGALIPSLLRGGSNASGASTPPASTTTTTITTVCRFQEDTTSWSKLDTQYAMLQTMQLEQSRLLNQIDSKLGAQLGAGGIAGKLSSMAQLAAKTWNFLQVDRVLNVLNWLGTLHNAYMLSNALGQTLFSLLGTGLDIVGIQKVDENGNESPYDVGEILGNYADNFAKSIFGVESWNGIKQEWKKYNRIYQAATNLLFSIQSITYSMASMIETTSNYVGKIGNALKRSGGVLQNAFGWMSPNSQFTNNRFFNGLNQAQETVENIDQIVSDVKNIQDTSADLADRKNEFDQLLSQKEQAVSTAESTSAGVSTKPLLVISPSDEKRADQ